MNKQLVGELYWIVLNIFTQVLGSFSVTKLLGHIFFNPAAGLSLSPTNNAAAELESDCESTGKSGSQLCYRRFWCCCL